LTSPAEFAWLRLQFFVFNHGWRFPLSRYESRVGVDVDDIPPLTLEEGEEPTPHSSTGQDQPGESASAASSPTARSPSKRSRPARAAKALLDESHDSGTWRVRGADIDDGSFAYLEGEEFGSDDEDSGSTKTRSDKDSLQYEYETRTGVDVAHEPLSEHLGHADAAQRKPDARIVAAYAVRPRTTSSACHKLQAQKVGGLDEVCDPLLANTPVQLLGAQKCRRGAPVVLVARYARAQGLCKCLGLVGVLQRRAQVGVWNVLFPEMTQEVRVHVGHESQFGLFFADTVPGLTATTAATRWEFEYAAYSAPLKGGPPRDCSRGLAPAGRRTGDALLLQLSVGFAMGGGEGRQRIRGFSSCGEEASWQGVPTGRKSDFSGKIEISDAEVATAQVVGEEVVDEWNCGGGGGVFEWER